MNQKTKVLQELNKYVSTAPKWELPSLRVQCVAMINMIDHRLYGKPKPIKIHWWQRLFLRKKQNVDRKK